MKHLLAFCSAAVAIFLTACQHYQPAPLDAGQTAASLDARSLADPGLRSFVETNLHHPFAVWPPPAWDFQTLTFVALYYHPSLDVARAQWAVARAGMKTAGGRLNPSVGFTPQYVFNPGGLPAWVNTLNFDIPIETAGKRGHRLAQAARLSESARLGLAAQAWQVRSALRGSLLQSAAAQRRVALLQDQLETSRQILKLIEARLAAGAITALEVTPVRIAMLKVQTDLTEAGRVAGESRASVAAALGLPVRALDGVELQFDLSLAAGAGLDLETAEARERALHSRADILAGLAEYAASESALHLEMAKQYPDVHLNTGYEYDQGLQKWGLLGFGTELPLFNRNQGPIAEAQARRAECAARFLALQARVLADIDRALAGRAAVREQLRQIEALLETQRQQVQSLETTVKAGGADQLDVRTAQLEARLTELARLDALVKAQQALGQLEDAIQFPFEGLKSVEQGRATPATKEKP